MFTLLLLTAVLVIVVINAAHADPLSDFLGGIFGSPAPQPAPAHVRHGRHEGPVTEAPAGASVVRASWYGGGEKLAKHTASGEVFRPHGLTAAHRTLPLGTMLHVCYRACAMVRVNDRGPAVHTGRSLDLSRGAASAIGLTGVGVANVHMSVAGR